MRKINFYQFGISVFLLCIVLTSCSTTRTGLNFSETTPLQKEAPQDVEAWNAGKISQPSSMMDDERHFPILEKEETTVTEMTPDRKERTATKHKRDKKVSVNNVRIKTKRDKKVNSIAHTFRTGVKPGKPMNPAAPEGLYIGKIGGIVLAFILPPLGAGLYFGVSREFWITLILWIFFWLPGFIYAAIMIGRD